MRKAVIPGFILLITVLGGCHTAAVAVRPDDNHIAYAIDSTLKQCDQNLLGCDGGKKLTVQPVAAAFINGGANLAFLGKDGRVYRCNASGESCQEMPLNFSDAAAISGGPNASVIVIYQSGHLDICSGGSCQKH